MARIIIDRRTLHAFSASRVDGRLGVSLTLSTRLALNAAAPESSCGACLFLSWNPRGAALLLAFNRLGFSVHRVSGRPGRTWWRSRTWTGRAIAGSR